MKGDSNGRDLDTIFGIQGPLAQAFAEYQLRPEQLEMARVVERAVEQGQNAIIEAPTGLGKSYAYLIPAILSGKRVIVATANKSLQNQLADKDVPNLIRGLGLDIKYTLAKGRSNYVCHHKWRNYVEEFEEGNLRAGKESLLVMQEIKLSMEEPGFSGDIDYLSNPLPRRLAREFVSFPNDCIGGECRYANSPCFVDSMRQDAFQSQLIITNHHLLLYSLKPEHEDQLLPEADIYIVDEAHNLENAATTVFQTTVNSGTLPALLESKAFKKALSNLPKELESHNRTLFESFSRDVPRDKPIHTELAGFSEMGSRLEDAADWMDAQSAPANLVPEFQSETDAEHRAAVSALKSLAGDYQRLAMEDPEYVRYSQVISRGGLDFNRAPLRPADHLHRLLFEEDQRSVICTSATMTTQGSFDHFRNQCGLSIEEAVESQLPHIFDYGRQALLYQPSMPRFDYQQPDPYYKAAAAKIRELLEITNGNTLCLFTNWKGLNIVFDILTDRDSGVVWPVRSQGEDVSRRELLEWFQTTPHSVLCATRSFWEGIDIPGDSLVSVVLDKLPFPSPNDPIHKQRMQLIEKENADGTNLNSFAGYMLPHMALALRQGFGRLIRRIDDQGVVTILDVRLENSRYGPEIRENDLPPALYSRHLDDVFRFLEPDLRRRPVYGLNIFVPLQGESSTRVEFTVPKLGLTDTVHLKGIATQDVSASICLYLTNSLQMLRRRIEDKGGVTAESVVEIRCPTGWIAWVQQVRGSDSIAWVQEKDCWFQVKWTGLVGNC